MYAIKHHRSSYNNAHICVRTLYSRHVDMYTGMYVRAGVVHQPRLHQHTSMHSCIHVDMHAHLWSHTISHELRQRSTLECKFIHASAHIHASAYTPSTSIVQSHAVMRCRSVGLAATRYLIPPAISQQTCTPVRTTLTVLDDAQPHNAHTNA